MRDPLGDLSLWRQDRDWIAFCVSYNEVLRKAVSSLRNVCDDDVEGLIRVVQCVAQTGVESNYRRVTGILLNFRGLGNIIGKNPSRPMRTEVEGSNEFEDHSRDRMKVTVFKSFCAAGTIRAGCTTSDSKRDHMFFVVLVRVIYPLLGAGIRELLGYVVDSGCHVLLSQQLGRN